MERKVHYVHRHITRGALTFAGAVALGLAVGGAINASAATNPIKPVISLTGNVDGTSKTLLTDEGQDSNTNTAINVDKTKDIAANVNITNNSGSDQKIYDFLALPGYYDNNQPETLIADPTFGGPQLTQPKDNPFALGYAYDNTGQKFVSALSPTGKLHEVYVGGPLAKDGSFTTGDLADKQTVNMRVPLRVSPDYDYTNTRVAQFTNWFNWEATGAIQTDKSSTYKATLVHSITAHDFKANSYKNLATSQDAGIQSLYDANGKAVTDKTKASVKSITPTSDPAKFSVVYSYDGVDSKPVTATISDKSFIEGNDYTVNYESDWNGQKFNGITSLLDQDGKDVKATDKNVTVSVTDANGKKVDGVDTSNAGAVYNVTYTYDGIQKTVKVTVGQNKGIVEAKDFTVPYGSTWFEDQMYNGIAKLVDTSGKPLDPKLIDEVDVSYKGKPVTTVDTKNAGAVYTVKYIYAGITSKPIQVTVGSRLSVKDFTVDYGSVWNDQKLSGVTSLLDKDGKEVKPTDKNVTLSITDDKGNKVDTVDTTNANHTYTVTYTYDGIQNKAKVTVAAPKQPVIEAKDFTVNYGTNWYAQMYDGITKLVDTTGNSLNPKTADASVTVVSPDHKVVDAVDTKNAGAVYTVTYSYNGSSKMIKVTVGQENSKSALDVDDFSVNYGSDWNAEKFAGITKLLDAKGDSVKPTDQNVTVSITDAKDNPVNIVDTSNAGAVYKVTYKSGNITKTAEVTIGQKPTPTPTPNNGGVVVNGNGTSGSTNANANSSSNNATTATPTTNGNSTATTPSKTTADTASTGSVTKGSVVYAVKPVYMYKAANFKKSQRLAAYPKAKRVSRPMFVVLGTKRASNGALRYKVRDVNHGKKTANKVGYITANGKYVVSVYYRTMPKSKKITVISPKGVHAYKSKNLTGKAKTYKKGTRLTVKKVVKHNLTTRYQLSNGYYVTANKKLVIQGNY